MTDPTSHRLNIHYANDTVPDAPTRATGRYAASPGDRARGLSFTALFNLTKRDLPAGVQR